MRARPATHLRLTAALTLACILIGSAFTGCSSGTSSNAGGGSSTLATATAGGSTAPGAPAPSTTLSAVAPAAPDDPPGTHHFTLYWIRDCADPEHAVDIATCRIAVGESRVTDKEDVATAALETLMLGPSDVEKLNGEQSNIRTGTRFSGIHIDNGTAVVAFNRFFETAKTRPQVAQVVFTLTQFPEIKNVQFLVDGQSNGATGVAAMDRNDLSDMAPAVLLEAPALNATVPASFRMHGTAVAASGDTFDYRVLGPGDTPLVTDKVVVLASPGTRGPFVEPVTLPAGTTGPVTIVTSGPKGEVRTPVTIG